MTGSDSNVVAGEIPSRERRREHERLERRPGLALALDGEVELALAVVAAADHREDRAAVRVDRDERGRRAVGFGSHFCDRLLRELLEAEVDRRLDAEAAAVHDRRADTVVEQLLLDVVGEVRRLALDVPGRRMSSRRRQRRARCLRGTAGASIRPCSSIASSTARRRCASRPRVRDRVVRASDPAGMPASSAASARVSASRAWPK